MWLCKAPGRGWVIPIVNILAAPKGLTANILRREVFQFKVRLGPHNVRANKKSVLSLLSEEPDDWLLPGFQLHRGSLTVTLERRRGLFYICVVDGNWLFTQRLLLVDVWGKSRPTTCVVIAERKNAWHIRSSRLGLLVRPCYDHPVVVHMSIFV
jgi:hypothetical protein